MAESLTPEVLARHRENAEENVRRSFGGVAYLPSTETVALIDSLEACQAQISAAREALENELILDQPTDRGVARAADILWGRVKAEVS